MKKWILTIVCIVVCTLSLEASDIGNFNFGSGSDGSSATVEIKDILIGSKDKLGRYSVKIKVEVSNLDYGETVRTIGIEYGTNKRRPDHRDTRSGKTVYTFLVPWKANVTYYVTPILKTDRSGGELSGRTCSYRTP